MQKKKNIKQNIINGITLKFSLYIFRTLGTSGGGTAAAVTTATPHGTPHGGNSTHSRNSMGESMPVPSVGSPATPAASPHPNSTMSQPTSVAAADQVSFQRFLSSSLFLWLSS